MPVPHDPWQTFPTPERKVLVVVRSVPAAGRLLDAVEVFGGDLRIRVDYTLNPGSVSEAGIRSVLAAGGVDQVLPWEDAVARRGEYALALAASPKDGLHRLSMAGGTVAVPGPTGPPLLLMPHGAGHNRLVGETPGALESASGLAPEQLLHAGAPIPTALALSHHEQRARIAGALRGVRTEVVGDPSFDRMAHNAGRRDRFRRALGVPEGGRLVVLSSTWNRDSLVGSVREGIRRILRRLPNDTYRTALVVHPNVWHRHGQLNGLDLLLRQERAAGLALVDPHEGWRAALIAADAVVGDHGSTTYYAAALGRPVLLAAFGRDELDPASPLHAFGAACPSLGPEDDPLERIEEAIAGATKGPSVDGHGPGIGDLLIDHQGEAAERLRALCYALMGLEPPPGPVEVPGLDGPVVHAAETTAWRVTAEDGGTDLGAPVLRTRLRPAAVCGPTDGALLVSVEDPSPARAKEAEALVRPWPVPEPEAVAWARAELERRPVAALAVAALPGGEFLLAEPDAPWTRIAADGPADAVTVAAAAAAWLHRDALLVEWGEKGAVVAGPQGKTRLRVPPPRLISGDRRPDRSRREGGPEPRAASGRPASR
ncbi:hypothetical protein O4J56_05035 [Nocardiopsis sp. RSe5-2]|uniref:Translation initiation factor 2 n=1 Tax=Nocardiopsis endophytica TaxID=3018445 RepID=A0ABT4TZ67_9ACTN|nr:hypothetical protein [Nocardiopsis endophytica]MDA2809994.1 hypothetical protein [Nocardiopsis endophytica]